MNTTQNISVGQLSAMTPDTRTLAIKALSPAARTALAHLAVLGASTSTARAVEHLDAGHDRWARAFLARAGTCAEIAAALTTASEPQS